MRNMLLAVVAVCALSSSAQSAETRNFELDTTGDLVALCSCPPEDPLYAQALQFCYGYMTGVAHLHRILVDAEEIERLACPDHQVTRDELVQVFLSWARGHPEAMEEAPGRSVRAAAVETWPCGG